MRRARWTYEDAATGESVGPEMAHRFLTPGAVVVRQWLQQTFPSPRPVSLPEAAEIFGIPLKTLYRLARQAPENGVPIIKFHARHFAINPQRFAEWLYGEAAMSQVLGASRKEGA